MATKKHTCVQGDSYRYKYTPKSGDTLDSDWAGTWAIVDILGSGRTTLASGALTKDDDDTYFKLHIPPSSTDIAIAEYYLVVEVTNATLGINREIVQDIFDVTKQGI